MLATLCLLIHHARRVRAGRRAIKLGGRAVSRSAGRVGPNGGPEGRDGAHAGYDPTEVEITLASPALLRLPARSAESKNSLPFGRRGGVESGLLGEPGRSSLLFDLACRLESRSLGSFCSGALCSFARHRLASVPLSFCDPDVAGRDDRRSGFDSFESFGVFRNCPSTLDLSLLRSTGST
jgi:hypothetical protein